MDRLFQIFVSSTFLDLESERGGVFEVILKMGHMPSGMEYFPASTMRPLDLIKKQIDVCDVFVVIVAGRYGSIESEGVSYTEREYEYAYKTKKPILVFPKDFNSIVAGHLDSDRGPVEKFRNRLKTHTNKTWCDTATLKEAAYQSLPPCINDNKCFGWVRGGNLSPTSLNEENRQLRDKCEDLQKRLEQHERKQQKSLFGLADLDVALCVQVHQRHAGRLLLSKVNVNLAAVFTHIAPHLRHWIHEGDLNYVLANICAQVGNAGSSRQMLDKDMSKILIHYYNHGLVEYSDKINKQQISHRLWRITEKGESEFRSRLTIHDFGL
ncbi:MAG: DUF4062 domain-containing protein [Phycisphaeraceae bacterium]|nr:DUF4062 domain-containing protein [Phycisphaeraceae bacterium]